MSISILSSTDRVIIQKSCMYPIRFVERFMAFPPGEEYDGYEKLVLPFDGSTWFWTAFTFALAFATVAIAKVSKPLENFVKESFASTPSLNIVGAFFGISQIKIPSKSFARYVFINLIIFSLIIRTAYQGVMFEFLQKEMRKPTVTSIDEMIEQNFTFYMSRGYKSYYKKSEFVKM